LREKIRCENFDCIRSLPCDPSGKFARSEAKVRSETGVVQCRFEQHYAIFGMKEKRHF
jgi:hypothetical protein